MSFLQSFAVGLLSYARRKPFRAMAWLSFIHWVLNFARRFYNRLVNDRFIRKIPSPKALLHPILGMVPSLAVSLTGTGIMTWPQYHTSPQAHGGALASAIPRHGLARSPSQGLLKAASRHWVLGPPPSVSRPPLILGRPSPCEWWSRTRFAPHIRSAPSLTPSAPLGSSGNARHLFRRAVRLL
jgi:hypothetical protein